VLVEISPSTMAAITAITCGSFIKCCNFSPK
jgi:hypothetical protein